MTDNTNYLATGKKLDFKTGTLWDWSEFYQDTEEFNKLVIDAFSSRTNDYPTVKAHRDFIEESQNRFNMIYGHGHRSLQYLWKLLVDEMPKDFKFLEIGVYKGQILSLVQMLADMAEKKPKITGITPLFDAPFANYNRGPFIENIYKQFGLKTSNTQVFDGLSQNPKIVSQALVGAPYDMVYVDGDHSYEATVFDINTYSKMIKKGGFLVVDDCSDYKNIPQGTFKGILDVSNAVKDTVEKNQEFKEVMTVMHVRVWQKVKDDADVPADDFWNSMV